MDRIISEQIYKKSCASIPGGVNSPVRSFKGLGLSPMIVDYGKGDQIWDIDGYSYIDYCLSWGPLILGHADQEIVRSVAFQMEKGSTFGIATSLEEELAIKIKGHYPSIEKIRFVSSGTEATMTALRLARGYTERPKIVKFIGHYHGHLDALLVQAGSGVYGINPFATSKGVNPGTIADTILLPFNDFELLSTLFENDAIAASIAAVIVEPVAGNMGVVPPAEGFLRALREYTTQVGALLIFDEVMTGYRVGLSGAQGLFNITPDLTCLGKVVGGGFPAAAVGGRKEIMDCLAPLGEVYQAGTLSGNPVAMRAGLETLKRIEKKGFYEDLFAKTRRLLTPLEQHLLKRDLPIAIQSVGSMFTIFFGVKKVESKNDLANLDETAFIQFFQYLFERGIYTPPASQEASFLSIAHTDEHIDYTAHTILEFFDRYH